MREKKISILFTLLINQHDSWLLLNAMHSLSDSLPYKNFVTFGWFAKCSSYCCDFAIFFSEYQYFVSKKNITFFNGSSMRKKGTKDEKSG